MRPNITSLLELSSLAGGCSAQSHFPSWYSDEPHESYIYLYAYSNSQLDRQDRSAYHQSCADREDSTSEGKCRVTSSACCNGSQMLVRTNQTEADLQEGTFDNCTKPSHGLATLGKTGSVRSKSRSIKHQTSPFMTCARCSRTPT